MKPQEKQNFFTHLNEDAFQMQRKNTVKRHTEPFTFCIYDDESRVLKVNISPNSTVGELLAEVKSRYPKKGVMGLMSRDNNEIIDYALKLKHLPIFLFQNGSSFGVQRASEVVNLSGPTLDDFEFLKLLGSGVSCCVYLVRHRCNGMLYALKQINKSYFQDFKKIEQILRERKIMIEVTRDLPFTTKLEAAFESEKSLNFLIEFYPGGEMFVHIQRRKLLEEEARLYAAEMVLTFEKLHERKVIYRDLKPENVMIDFEGHARLGDFGLCKLNLDYYDLTYSYCGSDEYMAPEVRSENGYNYGVDFYTLGSFIYELVHGVPPYYNNQPLFFSSDASEEFIEVITRLIESNMHKRLKNIAEIKRMKWFKGVDWKKVEEKRYDMAYRVDLSQNYIGEEFKNKNVDPENLQESNFDRLLECFAYIRKNQTETGISKFYNSGTLKKKTERREQSHKKKHSTGSLERSSNSKGRKSNHSSQSSKSKGNSLSKTGATKSKEHRKKIGPQKNIYVSDNLYLRNNHVEHGFQKNSKRLFNSSSSRDQKNNFSISKKDDRHQNDSMDSYSHKAITKDHLRKPIKEKKKLTMKTLKGSNAMSTKRLQSPVDSTAVKRVKDLERVFSPKKMRSPEKSRNKIRM